MMTSTEPFQSLAQALRDRKNVIADRDFYARDPAGHLARLQAVSEQITALAAELPRPLDPQLAHFLERCSEALRSRISGRCWSVS